MFVQGMAGKEARGVALRMGQPWGTRGRVLHIKRQVATKWMERLRKT